MEARTAADRAGTRGLDAFGGDALTFEQGDDHALEVETSVARSRARAQRLPDADGQSFELRDYGIGAQILTDLGVSDMILLTNAHRTLIGITGYGLTVVGERPIPLDD